MSYFEQSYLADWFLTKMHEKCMHA